MNLTESLEMYLETIYVLSKSNENVHAIDIAKYMNFSKPSVSVALKNLKCSGFVNISESGVISLTDIGLLSANTTYEKHETLTNLLIMMGVNEDTALTDACKIEHVISEETFNAIKEYLKQKA
ncbi:MAG: metal-dependent transcriptional regulator [Anaeroplasmataceae bacterium]